MKNPALRVTKWLGDIPVEAECTSCPGEPKLQAYSVHHRPSKADYQERLQRAFDRHLYDVHRDEHSNARSDAHGNEPVGCKPSIRSVTRR